VNVFLPSLSGLLAHFNVGDVVVIRNNGQGSSFQDQHVGDIIVFHTNDAGGRTIVHRIVEIYSDANNSERLVKTKGDNNPVSYGGFDYPIYSSAYGLCF
jgi:signal peptidase I